GPARLGVVVLDGATGQPLDMEGPVEAGPSGEIPGTWWSPEPVRIVAPDEADRLRRIGLGEALLLADRDRCEDVWPRAKKASRHLARDTAWLDRFGRIA